MNKKHITKKYASRSFKEALTLQRGGFLIYDFSLPDGNGERNWYLFSVSPSKEAVLVEALESLGKDADLDAFGKILASGEGSNPPEAIKKQIFSHQKANL